MAGSKRTDKLVLNLSLFERARKERKIVWRRAAKALREFKTVVSLNALDGKTEPFKMVEHMNEKLCRGICTVLFKGFKITISRKLIDSGILIESFTFGCPHKASRRDKFDIYLYTLTGIIHLFIRFGDILGILWLDRHLAVPAKHTV